MEIGSQVGPYRIESLLGRGGMAEVFKVWHQDLHRGEAMKVLPPALTFDRSFVERFLREARTAAGLQHPNIATVFTVSSAEAPQPYFTMELIEGGDLADLIEARGRFSLDEALSILRQVAAALDYAGGRGLIHRDIKPANVMLGSDNQVKVVDFGIARAHEEAGGTRMTKTGMIVGTPEYMSPEQAGSGAPVDARTDQYSLGVIAYEMLCGAPPFRAQSETGMLSVLMAHVRDAPRPPLEQVPGLGANTNNALLQALAKNPADRFSSCSEFVRALEGGVRVAAPSKSASARPQSLRLVPTLVGAALLVGVSLIGYSVWSGRGSSEIEVAPPTDTRAQSSTEALIAENTQAESEPTLAPLRQFANLTATASHSMKAKGYDYGPNLVLDGRADTAWNTENSQHGVGEWIQLSWNGEREVSRIGVVVGYDKYNSKKQYAGQPHMWFRNNRLHQATLHFSNGETRTVSFKDITAMQYQQFERVRAQWCRLEVTAVYLDMFGGKQKRWDDLAIGEIQIWGRD
jgi:serine/threonine protein kinase